ncbi:Heterodisulfide reductase, subunit A (polyferredoxin) [Methanophagales archaeon]|nr:Heterodisulfide reductase, subunit A (polyferredoxin) [Methanophagales archaeon]
MEELKSLEEEGIKIIFLANPTKILGSSRVEKLECVRMELGPPDDTGRRRPVPVEGTEFVMDVDTVIPAIGQASDLQFLEGSGVDTPGGRRISAFDDGRTAVAGIFAGGDAATGAKTVIEAIAAGKRAALSIYEYLSGEKFSRADFKVESEIDLEEREARGKSNLLRNYFTIKDIALQKRVEMPKLPAEVRITDFKEEELGYDAKRAVEEANRCLSCRKCIGCGICAEVCPQDAIVYDQTEERLELSVGKLIFAADMEENVPPGEYMYSNVVTQIEFERMVSDSGPYGGIIMRPFDGDIPREIAFISVFDADVCTPIAFEFLVQAAKSAKERDVESCIFARELYRDTGDIKSVKIRDIRVTELEETKNLRLQYVVDGEREEQEKEVDMVVLSAGFSLQEYVKKLGGLVGIMPEEIESRMWGKPGKGLVEVEIAKTDKEGVFIAA